MQFSKEVLEAIEYGYSEIKDGYDIIDGGRWVSDHKMDTKQIIFSAPDGKCYGLDCWREGDDWSGYTYGYESYSDFEEVPEVVPVEKTITVWERVDA